MRIRKVHVIFKTHLDIGFTILPDRSPRTIWRALFQTRLLPPRLHNITGQPGALWTVARI